MKRMRGVFRVSALAAKGRLGSGFWVDAKTIRDTNVKTAKSVGKSSEEVLNLFINQIRRQITASHIVDTADEQFYQRIRSILSSAPNNNPLASILDRDYMRELSDAERERYVFTLSEQVQRCVARFEQEREFVQIKTAGQ